MSHTIGQAKRDTQQSNFNQSVKDRSMPEVISSEPTTGLSDADYEFLFNQLLEGITHGWHDHRIIKFFARLGDRGQQADWVIWLERLREKLLKLPTESKRSLGAMMIRLGELTQGAPEVSQIGAASHRIGRELLFGNSPAEIWEYTGADLADHQNQMESPQELSARLPDDFSALADQLVKETGLEQDIESKISDTPAVENDADDVIESLVSILDTEPETEVWQNQQDEIFQGSETESSISAQEKTDIDLNLSLDLDLKQKEPDQVSNDGEQLEFELDELQALQDQDYQSPLGATSFQDLNPKDEKLKPLESPVPVANSLVLEQQRDILPSTPDPQALDTSSLELIESWFNLGLKQVSAGEYTEAIASWDRALKINANLPEAWHNRGSALGRLGNYEAAIKSFQSALAIDPDNYQAWNDRAHALYQLENWTGAIESWSQAIKIMPGNHLFWYNRGCALEQIAKWSEAIASYEKALEIKPDFQPGRSRYINLVADNSRPN
ncbi:MAG: tetratricopeptide repeat protein [Waterburya sp.]